MHLPPHHEGLLTTGFGGALRATSLERTCVPLEQKTLLQTRRIRQEVNGAKGFPEMKMSGARSAPVDYQPARQAILNN